jgi:peptidoglycan/LPS O-acetylase OafA/YrhL
MTAVAAATKSRDWYIDAWRGAALLRVIAFHGTAYAWLTVAFPALTARSLDQRPAVSVVRSRLRRLLPPLWVYAVLLVPLTLRSGWGAALATPWDRLRLLFWVAPLEIPPVGGAYLAESVSTVLWYLSLYLWFVLLSPLMLRVFRACPHWTLAAVLVAMLALQLNVIVTFQDLPPVPRHLAIYICCWLLGFAHHDGLLRKVPGPVFVAVVGATALVAAYGVLWEGITRGDFNLNLYPLVYALWSAVFVTVVLRLDPAAGQSRTGPIRRLVAAINARAVTIYLWHYPCVAFAFNVIVARLSLGDPSWRLVTVVLGSALTAVPVLLLGWVEDLAARRPARLVPAMPRTAPVEAEPSSPRGLGARWHQNLRHQNLWHQDLWGRAAAAALAALVLTTTLSACLVAGPR